MTNLERLLEQSKKIRDGIDNHTDCSEREEIKDQMIAVMFKALNCSYPQGPLLLSEPCNMCHNCSVIYKIEQLAAQALGEK